MSSPNSSTKISLYEELNLRIVWRRKTQDKQQSHYSSIEGFGIERNFCIGGSQSDITKNVTYKSYLNPCQSEIWDLFSRLKFGISSTVLVSKVSVRLFWASCFVVLNPTSQNSYIVQVKDLLLKYGLEMRKISRCEWFWECIKHQHMFVDHFNMRVICR